MVSRMIRLRGMHSAEYGDYCRYFIADYSQEMANNYGHDLTLAKTLAEKALHEYLPQGPATAGHHVLCIDAQAGSTDSMMGYLWYAHDIGQDSCYIYDFYIKAEYRGEGHAKAAINALEARLLTDGVTQIKLRVAYDNQRALALYQSAGFTISGYNMSKNIQ